MKEMNKFHNSIEEGINKFHNSMEEGEVQVPFFGVGRLMVVCQHRRRHRSRGFTNKAPLYARCARSHPALVFFCFLVIFVVEDDFVGVAARVVLMSIAVEDVGSGVVVVAAVAALLEVAALLLIPARTAVLVVVVVAQLAL